MVYTDSAGTQDSGHPQPSQHSHDHQHSQDSDQPQRTGLVLVSSTRAAAGVYTDESGPIAVQFLRDKGFHTPDARVIADKDISRVIDEVFASPDRPDVILTSGGTGISPDDQVIESIQPRLDKELPGIAHAFWSEGLAKTPTAVISRALAGTVGETFVMAMPGSPGGVRDGVKVLDGILLHALNLLKGRQVSNHGKHHS